MDGHQQVAGRIGHQMHETDRHSVGLLALIYQALLADSSAEASSSDSEQPTPSIPPNQPLVQEAQL